MGKYTTADKGKAAEEYVVEVLCRKGFRLLCRNFAVHNVGEIDSAFVKGDTVYIVEVRARKLIPDFPTPAESVTRSKKRKIERTSSYLINRYDLCEKNIYFLLGQVTLDDCGLVKNVEFIPF